MTTQECIDSGQHGLLIRAGVFHVHDDADNTCRHCGRAIGLSAEGIWIDPEATGDDSIWRETCDANDTFEANHEPEDSQ